MARAGLSNADVLRIATVQSAACLGIGDRVGTIAPGKIANLLILDENQLATFGCAQHPWCDPERACDRAVAVTEAGRDSSALIRRTGEMLRSPSRKPMARGTDIGEPHH